MSSENRAKVTVDPAGSAGLYQHSPLPGYTCLGVVTQGSATGALYRNKSTGMYVVANAGSISSIDQRKVLAALGSNASKMDDGRRRNVYMSDRDAAYLKNLGAGNLSEGIRAVINHHRN
jgi:hypothetical protein